jgi:hypothetical protein
MKNKLVNRCVEGVFVGLGIGLGMALYLIFVKMLV